MEYMYVPGEYVLVPSEYMMFSIMFSTCMVPCEYMYVTW
jgi:hypothetical protein